MIQITGVLAISINEIRSNGFKYFEYLLLLLLLLLLCSKRQTNISDLFKVFKGLTTSTHLGCCR
jgi:hypothetical protein